MVIRTTLRVFRSAAPAQKKASYGALISIVLILMIVIVGAFYAWGARIASEQVTGTEGLPAATILFDDASSTASTSASTTSAQ